MKYFKLQFVCVMLMMLIDQVIGLGAATAVTSPASSTTTTSATVAAEAIVQEIIDSIVDPAAYVHALVPVVPRVLGMLTLAVQIVNSLNYILPGTVDKVRKRTVSQFITITNYECNHYKCSFSTTPSLFYRCPEKSLIQKHFFTNLACCFTALFPGNPIDPHWE